MNHTDKIMITAWGLWGCLGFYRGHRYYKKRKTQYYYITNFAFGLAGTACYTCPFLIFPFVIHELYNLEETIRKIDTDDYTNQKNN